MSSLKHPSIPHGTKNLICMSVADYHHGSRSEYLSENFHLLSIFFGPSLGLEMYKRFEFKVRTHGSEFRHYDVNLLTISVFSFLLKATRYLLSVHTADLCVIHCEICDL